MATITPTRTRDGETVYTWADMSTGDTIESVSPQDQQTTIAAIQFTGTFGGATVALKGSNDGTNWATLPDVFGTDISTASAALFDFSTAALYLKIDISGGTGDAVDATMVLRG